MDNHKRRELILAAIDRIKAAREQWMQTQRDPTSSSEDRDAAKDHFELMEHQFRWQWGLVEELLREPTESLIREQLDSVLNFLADQTYQGEPVLHSVIACDFASRQHMLDALERLVKEGRSRTTPPA